MESEAGVEPGLERRVHRIGVQLIEYFVVKRFKTLCGHALFRRAGRNFGLSPIALLARVVFPATLPSILVGLRIALGIAWLVVVAAEMIAVNSGLGYLVIDSRNSGKRYDLVVAAMILIGVIGLALDIGIRRLERLKSVRWGFRSEA